MRVRGIIVIFVISVIIIGTLLMYQNRSSPVTMDAPTPIDNVKLDLSSDNADKVSPLEGVFENKTENGDYYDANGTRHYIIEASDSPSMRG